MHTNFVNFGEGLVTAFSSYNKTCKIHTFSMGILKVSFFLLETQVFYIPVHYLMVENHHQRCRLLFFMFNSHTIAQHSSNFMNVVNNFHRQVEWQIWH